MAYAMDELGKVLAPLSKGSTGSDVTGLQNNLTKAGYNVGPTGSDGVYGPNTEAAVKQFQKENNITVDGKVGPETNSVLKTIFGYDNAFGSDVNLSGTTTQSSTKKDVGGVARVITAPPTTTYEPNAVDPNVAALTALVNQLLSQQQQPMVYNAPASNLPDWAKNLQQFNAPQTSVLSFDDALNQAVQLLNPKYDVLQRKLEGNLKQDQEARGLFFSPLGAQLSSDKLVDFNSDKQYAQNEYAQGLVTQSQDQANKQIEQALQQWQANTGLATTLKQLETDSNNSAFNQWLQQQQLGIDATNSKIDNIGKVINTIGTINEDKRAAVTEALKRADVFGKITNETDAKILGVPVGTDTLTAKQVNSQILNDTSNRNMNDVEAALKRAEVTGTVSNEADAKILGVPMGTTTQQAKVINAELDSKYIAQESAKIDNALKRVESFGSVATAEDAQILGVPIGTSSLQAKTTAAQIKSMQLGDAINRANLSGTITNAADAKLLGVKVGTSTLEARKFFLEQELAKIDTVMKRVDALGYVDREASKVLGVPIGTKTLAAKQLAQQLAIAKMENATQRASIKASNSGTSSSKINQLLDVWKITGYAPSGLESVGVKAGTPYAPDDQTKPDPKAIQGIQNTFATDSNTADDIYSVWQSPSRESAIAELDAAVSAASKSGQTLNRDAIMRAIDYKWPIHDNVEGPLGGGAW